MEIKKGNRDFGAFLMHYGSLGVVVEVTFRTVPMQILTCKKITTDFKTLCELYKGMNESSEYVKAWWFPESDDVHIWDVNEANEEEKSLFEHNNKKFTEISTFTDNRLNDAID